MARRKKAQEGLAVFEDLEKMIDRTGQSLEGFAGTITEWLHGFIAWIKKHKKLVVIVVGLVLAYNYFLKEEEDEEDE